MPENDVMYASRSAPTVSKNFPLLSRTEKRCTKAPIVLDMGEASREQGFLLNGCR
jgi:hypothetical protein